MLAQLEPQRLARDAEHARRALALAGAGGLLTVLYASYRMAFVDALSGLPNRRALDETLARLTGDYALAMVDVDHFKSFNDTHGHDAGDTVLRVEITDRVAPGVVYTTFHFPESGANLITTENSDWATNCPEYKVTAVQVVKVAQPHAWKERRHAATPADPVTSG